MQAWLILTRKPQLKGFVSMVTLYKDSSTEPLEQNISRVLLYELSGCVQELLREKVLEFEFVL